jgi:hypothetical protein
MQESRSDGNQETLNFQSQNVLLFFFDVLLADTGMTDCNPAKTPHLAGHDMSARKDDESRLTAENIKEFHHAVGAARFITYTVGYQIACATSALAKHMADPSVRHWMALKKLLRFLAAKET